MQHLHSYWRMPYIEAPQPDTKRNPFVDLPNTQDDKAVHLLYRGKHTYLVLNKFPYNAGHILAIPYREVGDLEALSADERADLMEAIVRAKRTLTLAVRPDGFNVGFNFGKAAGAGIPEHLHCHIVPRWSGDTNFMPVLGNTRVLPESMDAMWERLRQFVDQSE